MNLKLIARYVGIALVFNAVFMFISALVAAYYHFDSSFSPLLISAFITFVVGVFPLVFVRHAEDLGMSDGFMITVLSWVLSCIFGMLPYVLWGGDFTLINAWFESVSGYTTTGGTILREVELLPKGLLFWRSSTHFIGGIGVVIFMILVLPTISIFRLRISKMEISSLSKVNYRYKSKEIVKIIGSVYLGITLLSVVFLMICGMNFYDAVNHAFSIVSTGGFSTKNMSLQSFDSFPIELVTMVFMLLASMHFGLIFSSVATKSWKILKSPIIRLYLGIVVGSSLLISINLLSKGTYTNWLEALRHSFFQVISIESTTGFATADSSVWPLFSVMILMFLSVITACSGSTTGGIKLDRVWIFLKAVRVQIIRQLHPNAVVRIKVGNNIVDSSNAHKVSLYIALYIFILFVSALLLSLTGLDMTESISASVASIGNVGPGFGSCGSLGNFFHFTSFAKFVMSVEMLFGRLEIYPILLLFVFNRRG